MNQLTAFFSSIDRKTWMIIGVAIVLLIVLIMWLKNRNKETETKKDETKPKADNNTSGSGNNTFPLRMGSRGANVSKWQTYVNTKGGKLTVDGIWGPLTEADSLKYTGFNSVTMDYFNTVVK